MSLEVIGVGWGRTATNSLKLALEELGYGTTHHMWEVAHNMDRLGPLWHDALDGSADWPAVFDGNRAAVDWPVAGFWRDLADVYPQAKFILTTRSADSWYASLSETILKVIDKPENSPPAAVPVATLARRAVMRSIGDDWSAEVLKAKFNAHEAEVKQALSPDRLLVFAPTDGWAPLCDFLGQATPSTPFPRSNHRDEFFSNIDDID
jgi:hypothetical protein